MHSTATAFLKVSKTLKRKTKIMMRIVHSNANSKREKTFNKFVIMYDCNTLKM